MSEENASEEQKEVTVEEIKGMSSNELDEILDLSGSSPSRSTVLGDDPPEPKPAPAVEEKTEPKEADPKETESSLEEKKSKFFEGAAEVFSRETVEDSTSELVRGYNELQSKIGSQGDELGQLKGENENLKGQIIENQVLIGKAADTLDFMQKQKPESIKSEPEEKFELDDIAIDEIDIYDEPQLKGIIKKQQNNIKKLIEMRSKGSVSEVDVEKIVQTKLSKINEQSRKTSENENALAKSIIDLQGRFKDELGTSEEPWKIFKNKEHPDYEKAIKVKTIIEEATKRNSGEQFNLRAFYLDKKDREGFFAKKEEVATKAAKEDVLKDLNSRPKKVKTLSDIPSEQSQGEDFIPESVEQVQRASLQQIDKLLGIENGQNKFLI